MCAFYIEGESWGEKTNTGITVLFFFRLSVLNMNVCVSHLFINHTLQVYMSVGVNTKQATSITKFISCLEYSAKPMFLYLHLLFRTKIPFLKNI